MATQDEQTAIEQPALSGFDRDQRLDIFRVIGMEQRARREIASGQLQIPRHGMADRNGPVFLRIIFVVVQQAYEPFVDREELVFDRRRRREWPGC